MTITRFTSLSRLWPSLALLCGLTLLVGCAHDDVNESFPKPDYSYLPPLHLNVSQLTISNQVQPSEDDLTARSPSSPTDDLQLMAHQRLHTTGTSGTAHFVITRAEMTKLTHHSFSGVYAVQLTVDDPTHHHHGYVTARVQRTIEAPSSYSLEHDLHMLNTSLMDDMNVELEYQIRSHLGSWLTDATGTPLNAATVQSQDLSSSDLPALGSSPSAAPAPASSTGAPTHMDISAPARTYNAQEPAQKATSSTKLHSPPPGVLSLPQH